MDVATGRDESLAGLLARAFEPPDDLMLEAGAVGEVLVARIRLAVVLLIFAMPPIAWWSGARIEEVVTGAVIATWAMVFAIALLRKVRREGARVRWRFVSATFDVTSVTLVLSLFLVQELPHVAVNSRVVWELYLISIAATALRADPRVCLYAGALALLQYGAILWGASRFGDLNDPQWAPFIYGYMSWGDQFSRLLVIVAATLLALASVYQTRKLLTLSSQDRLTGIRNRAWLDTRLDRELRETALRGGSICLAMIDVDAFKPFNDRHGHLAGDAALRAIGQRLQHRFAEHGYVARYGGEEFTAVMPGLSLRQAASVCELVRASFERDGIDGIGGGDPVDSPTLSMGLAAWQAAESADALIDRADRALIEAKRAGRNRVVATGETG